MNYYENELHSLAEMYNHLRGAGFNNPFMFLNLNLGYSHTEEEVMLRAANIRKLKEDPKICKDDPVVDAVIHKFLDRSKQGMKKYNSSMHDNNKPTLDWINDAQEELMDGILYLQKLKDKIKDIKEQTNFMWGKL